MNKNANVIYVDSDQKHVGAVILYANGVDRNMLWYDQEFTKPISAEELFDLVLKGLAFVYETSGTEIVDVCYDKLCNVYTYNGVPYTTDVSGKEYGLGVIEEPAE